MWDSIYPNYVGKGFSVIVMDLPCHGKSRFNEDVCNMNFMANKVHEILYKQNIFEPLIVGHSMGGYVGLELLKLLPKASLVLLHSNFWEDPVEKKHDRDRVAEIVLKNKSLFIQEAIPGLFAAENVAKCADDIDVLINGAKEIPANEIAAATRGMRDRETNYDIMKSGRVSIIHGEDDPIITTAVLNDELSRLNEDINIVTIKNCGHMSIWEDKDALIGAMDRLLIG